MKRINHIALVIALALLSLPGMAYHVKYDSGKVADSEGIEIISRKVYSVRIFENTTREELEKYKQEAAEQNITITYENLQIVDGKIEAITMKVNCNDGFSGLVTVTEIPESGIGFIRDYAEDAAVPFQIGKVFQNKPISTEMEEEIEEEIEEEVEEEVEEEMEEESEDWIEDFGTAFNKGSKVNKDDKDRYSHELEFLIGLNNYLNEDNQFPDNDNAEYSVDPLTSWTYGINSVHEVKLNPYVRLNFQFGLQWYNFAMADSKYQIVKLEQEVDFVDTSVSRPEINPERSKMNITYLNVNFVPMIYTGKSSSSFRFGAGPYAGYRIGSKSKFKYDDDGKDKIKNNLHLNSWRYGLKAQVGWKGVDLFATYDLNPLFIENRGPELNAFSFGIIF